MGKRAGRGAGSAAAAASASSGAGLKPAASRGGGPRSAAAGLPGALHLVMTLVVAAALAEKEGTTSVENKVNPEDTWDSKEWLQKYGLKAQKLSFYDVLADCSFRRADGVVDIKAKPEDETVQTSADTNRKTIHAKYCNRFVHTPWKDGSLVHVNITKEKCKWYREKVHIVLARIQRRIKWLQDGSQLLFGKVHKDCIYVLIDTSHSMKSKLNLVKDKIIWFIQDPFLSVPPFPLKISAALCLRITTLANRMALMSAGRLKD